jgi:hypothetical protein
VACTGTKRSAREAHVCAWGPVTALVGAWRSVRKWLEHQKLLVVREGACDV